MITAEGWSPPGGAELRELYADSGLPRPELAKRMGATPRTLQSWANDADTRTISYADWFLLKAIIMERAEELTKKHAV